MKILHITNSLKLEAGGVAQGILSLTAFYINNGALPSVLSFDEPNNIASDLAYLTTISFGHGSCGTFSYHPRLVPWLKQNASKYDALIVDGLWQYHGYGVYRALKKTNIPYYVFTHGMLDPWFKYEYPFKHLKKYIFWLVAQRHILKNAKAVLFTCEEEKLLARKSFWPYHVREEVVGYGTTITDVAKTASPVDFFNKFPSLKNSRFFLFLGRIHEKKGCDLLIEAFAKAALSNQGIVLVMAGPDHGNWKPALEELAKSHGVENSIIWTGMLKDEVKWGALKAAEVFILPSHQENFGIAVVEALAVGTPVLISNKVNIWREIEEMGAGLVGRDTVDGITDIINGWIKLSDKEKKQIEKNAVRCYENIFNMEQASKNLVNLIKRDLGSI